MGADEPGAGGLGRRPRPTHYGDAVEVALPNGRSAKRGRIVTFEDGTRAFHRDVRLSLVIRVAGKPSWLLEQDLVDRLLENGVADLHYHLKEPRDRTCTAVDTFAVVSLRALRANGSVDMNGRLQCFLPIGEWRSEVPWYDAPAPHERGGTEYEDGREACRRIAESL